jgi:hypothetical protein
MERSSVVRWYRPLCLGLTVPLLVWAVAVWIARVHAVDQADAWGLDYRVFRAYGERFLATGSLYLPWQLSGPYGWAHLPQPPAEVAFEGSLIPCVYPPLVAYAVVPLVWLPPLVWWAVPLGLLGWLLATSRPAPWTWPLLALVAGLPEAPATVYVGGSTMWVAAFAAAGARWGWPAALIVLKPTFAPLALVGARQRSWWAALLGLAIASLPLAGEWMRYAAAVANAATGPGVPWLDMAALGVVWAASKRESGASVDEPVNAPVRPRLVV